MVDLLVAVSDNRRLIVDAGGLEYLEDHGRVTRARNAVSVNCVALLDGCSHCVAQLARPLLCSQQLHRLFLVEKVMLQVFHHASNLFH